jgi:hypothetical protein
MMVVKEASVYDFWNLKGLGKGTCSALSIIEKASRSSPGGDAWPDE